jgi:hypothetical protein
MLRSGMRKEVRDIVEAIEDIDSTSRIIMNTNYEGHYTFTTLLGAVLQHCHE